MPAEFAAVPVACVLAKTNVADDYKFGDGFFYRGDCALNGAFHIPRAWADVILVFGQAENFDGGNAERGNFFRKFDGVVNG